MKIRTHYEELNIPDNAFYSIRYVERHNDSSWHIDSHYSNALEIVVYRSIDGTLYLEGSKTKLKEQSVLVLPPYCIHGFTVERGRHDYYIIHVLPEFIGHHFPDFTVPHSASLIECQNEDYKLIDTVLGYLDCNKSESIASATIALFLSWLQSTVLSCPKSEIIKATTHTEKFTKLLKHLDEQPIYSLRVEEAASICHISKSHFFSLFKRHFGKTFATFMTDRQIAQAKYLLASTDNSITDIALSVGFSDASYFTKVFKEKKLAKR